MTLRNLRLTLLCGASLLVGFAAAMPAARAGEILAPNSVTQTTLPNGLRVIIKEAPSVNLVALNVWVRAGSADETEANNGVSHFLEHLLFKGTKKRGPGEFDLEIEGLGGMANASTTEDATQYYLVIAKPYLSQALDALGDVMSNPTFPASEFQREKGIITNELRRTTDDPNDTLNAWVKRLSFQKHPYRLPVGGTEQSVQAMTREKVVDFYQKYYVASNMSLVVVGAVKASEILPKIQAAFSGLRSGPAPDRSRAPEPIPQQAQRSVLYRPVQRGYLMFGYRAPALDNPADVCAMDLLLYILGEERAQGGRLNRELRVKRGLVSAIWGDFVTLREPGLLTIWAETDPAKLDEAQQAILAQIATVRDGLVPEDEIQRAKALLLGVYTLDNETYDGQSGTLGFYEAKGSYRFAVDYAKNVMQVTAADLQRVARKYLGENSYSLAVMQPKPDANAAEAPGDNAASTGETK